jgi:two-component system, NtrC family, sensor kinase
MNMHRRILVIDDNKAIHDDFRKILCTDNLNETIDAFESEFFGETTQTSISASFEIDSAYQGKEGLEMVEQAVAAKQPYSMAFVDVRMPPGWDGIETVARIWEKYPDLQVVICTAYSDYSWDEMTKALGQSDRLVILKKPFDNIEARQLAATLTEKWRLLQKSNSHVIELESVVAERTRELHQTNHTLELEILKHKQAEESLRLLSSAVEQAKESIVITDAELDLPGPRIVFVNPAYTKMTGYTAAEAIGKNPRILQGPRTDKAVLQRLRKNLEQGEVFAGETINYRKDGTEFDLEWQIAPIRNTSGKTTHFVAIQRDTTDRNRERRRVEAQLIQSQKLESVGQLAAGIAHEINTPTQYVGDNTRFVKDSFAAISKVLRCHEELFAAAKQNAVTPEMLAHNEEIIAASDLNFLREQIPSALEETLEGIERVSKIVRAMKEFSHPGGKEKTCADLNRAIESTVTVARNEWKYVADLDLELDPELPTVPCFLGEFNQAILNLIVNAAHTIGDVIKKSPGSKGRITIRTRCDGDHVEIRVSDTGAGIAEANRRKIFEPFFTTKDVGKGTGQGLSIVYGSIVKRHGGTATFETEVGRGTTFILRLPIAPTTSIASIEAGPLLQPEAQAA